VEGDLAHIIEGARSELEQLAGKRLLVTGVLTDASLGFAVASLAQREGAEIVVTAVGNGRKHTERAARKLPVEPDVIEFDVADPEPVTPSQPTDDAPSAGRMTMAPLTTAAELHRAQTAEAPRVPPEAFHQGMVVRHPEYGLGKVVALSGNGVRRTATIAFASTAGQRKFMLASSNLRPAKSE